MNTSFLKHQRTWVCILLAGLVVAGVILFCGDFRFKDDNFRSLLKYSVSRDTETDFNLGFESVIHNGLPKDWFRWGYPSYIYQVDSVVKYSGKYSLRIQAKGEPPFMQEFGAPTRSIPAIYAGENITVKAFMRTEGVDQPIGLMLRVDGNNNEALAFDNMQHKGITGTGEWTEYSVTVPLPEEAKTIYIGAIFSGKGALWVDDFRVLIDDKDISIARLKSEKTYKADLDTEFDKGSIIAIKSHTPQMLANLELLGRIWGFLKYYHPVVATGDYNWDAELFRIMSSIIDAENTDERDRIFVEWIDRLGKVKPKKSKNKAFNSMEIKLQPDFAWMENPELGKTLSQKLKDVKDAARNTEHYYIRFDPRTGNPIFKNEKSYPDMKYYDDSGMRLLALFRYWNMIEYFFPYKYLTDKNWNTVLAEFIPKFLDGFLVLDYKQTLLQLIVSVNDALANIWDDETLDNWKGVNLAPYGITFIEGKAVVTRFLDSDLVKPSGLKTGDVITNIEGKSIEKFVEERKPYTPSSNAPTQLHYIAWELLRSKTDKISLQIIRDGKPQNLDVACFPVEKIYVQETPKPSHRLLSPDIGYLWFGTLKNDSLPVILEKFKNTKGIIFDIRCYCPQDDSIFTTLCNYLMPQPTEFVKFTNGSIEQPGRFTFTAPLKVGNYNDQYYKGKVVILVNERTVNRAEYYTMAFQAAPQKTVIGGITAAFAANDNISWITLPGNIRTPITGIGAYYPDGRETQRIGVKLDMEVKPTIRGIIEGRDELLKKAMEIVLE